MDRPNVKLVTAGTRNKYYIEVNEHKDYKVLYKMYSDYYNELMSFAKMSKKFRHIDPIISMKSFYDWMDHVEPYYIVANDDTKIGFVITEYVACYNAYYIAEFYIEPEYRGNKYAETIFIDLLKTIRDKNKNVFWFAIDTNPAREIWPRLISNKGFKKTSQVFPKIYDDVLQYFYCPTTTNIEIVRNAIKDMETFTKEDVVKVCNLSRTSIGNALFKLSKKGELECIYKGAGTYYRRK